MPSYNPDDDKVIKTINVNEELDINICQYKEGPIKIGFLKTAKNFKGEEFKTAKPGRLTYDVAKKVAEVLLEASKEAEKLEAERQAKIEAEKKTEKEKK